MNTSFEKTYGVSFEDSLLENSSQIARKQTREEKRQVKNQHFRLASQKIEAEYVSTAVHKVYGGRISLRQHDKQRMKQYFMSVPDAKNRALKNKEKIEKGLKKPKDHVGSLSSYEIDTHKLDSEALAWTPENPPNFQSLGKDCIKSKKTLSR